jgi:HK97 family phage portal protein
MNIFSKLFDKTGNKPQSQQKKYNGYASQMINIPPNLSTGDFLRSYGEIGWLYACVSKIAQNVADVEWSAYVNGDTNNEVTENQSQALAVLNNPNPFTSRYELMEMTDMYMSLCGKCFWVLEKDKAGRNREIWCISPMDMWIVPDVNNYIKGYIYKTGFQEIPFDPDQVIFFSMPDPYNQYGGVGPAQGARNSLEVDKYSSEHNRNFFYNGAKLSGILNVETDLDDDSWDRLTAQFEDKYRGVDNAHRIAIIEGGKANFNDLTMNNKDMDFFNLRQLTRDEILGVFGVHKSILGLTDDVSRANAETAEYVFQKHVIRPRLRRIQDKLNNEFVKLFGENIKLQFTDPVPENKEFLVDALNQLVNKCIAPNEGRQILNKMFDDVNLEPLPNGDVIYYINNLVPMGTPPPTVPNSNGGDNNNDISNDSTNNSNTNSNIDDSSNNNDDNENNLDKSIKKKIQKSTKLKIKRLLQKSNSTRIQERDKLSKPLEDEFGDTITKYLNAMQDDVVKKIGNGSKDPVDLDVWGKTLQAIVEPLYTKIFKTGGNAVVNEFKSISNSINKDLGVSFNLKDPNVQKVIQNKVMKIKGVNQTTKDRVKDVIQDSYNSDEGYNIQDVIGTLKNDFTFSPQRAATIGRTETLSSLNQATMEGYKQNSDIIDGKAWLATDDDKTRDSHVQAGEDYSTDSPIDVNDQFNVGGYDCDCPGDDDLPPEEVINCRCCLQPVINTGSDNGNDNSDSNSPSEESYSEDSGLSDDASSNDNSNNSDVSNQNSSDNDDTNDENSDTIDTTELTREQSLKDLGQYSFSIDGYSLTGGTIRDVDVTEFVEGFRVVQPVDLDKSKQTFDIQQVADKFREMPKSLTENVTEIQILDYRNSDDLYWEKTYNIKDFRSYATGGNNQIHFYANEQLSVDQNNSELPSTLAHEAGHNLDVAVSSQNNRFSNSKEWAEIMDKDFEFKNSGDFGEAYYDYGKYCSSYPQQANSSCEDFAEAVNGYVTDKERFSKEFPNRTKKLEELMNVK